MARYTDFFLTLIYCYTIFFGNLLLGDCIKPIERFRDGGLVLVVREKLVRMTGVVFS